jgi:hypothetical protein
MSNPSSKVCAVYTASLSCQGESEETNSHVVNGQFKPLRDSVNSGESESTGSSGTPW